MAGTPSEATEGDAAESDGVDREALWEAYQEGLALEKLGDLDAAAEAYRAALALDPDDHGGVSMRLAAIGRAASPERAPPAYVATLFDQHAEDFDAILVDQLSYRTPQDIAAALAGMGPFPTMLDLGCGTGLCAVALEGVTETRTGVDLAEAMLGEADDRDLYDALFVGDAEGFLEAAQEEGESWDLIVAADVLPYLGPVETLFADVAACLNPGGVFAFSTENLVVEAAAGWGVGPKIRYGHGEPYLRGTLSAAGMSVVSITPIVVRTDDGAPVEGQLFVAQRG